MARKAFGGDNIDRLPKGMVEPYRLWFEYLKLALQDKTINVDRALYKDWGDVANTNFNNWWGSHWRHLFAISTPTKAIRTVEDIISALTDQDCLIIRVSLTDSKKRLVQDIKKEITQALKNRSHPFRPRGKARFEIQSKRSINRSNLRVMLKMYQLWLHSDQDLEKAARAYYRWASDWNTKIRERNWSRKPIAMPSFLRRFIEMLDAFDRGKGSLSASNRRSKSASGAYNSMRSQTQRYLRQAQTIAKNVGRGVFPGEFKSAHG